MVGTAKPSKYLAPLWPANAGGRPDARTAIPTVVAPLLTVLAQGTFSSNLAEPFRRLYLGRLQPRGNVFYALAYLIQGSVIAACGRHVSGL